MGPVGAGGRIFPSSFQHARTALALAVIVGCALALRMAPWLQDPDIQLISDAAYHERLVTALVLEGRLPVPDSLSEPPEGRRLGELLPEGLYAAAAAACRSTGARDSSAVHRMLLWWTGTWGALIALPVWLATKALWRDEKAAIAAAAIAAFLPAHVHRTVCYWLRYDALGTLLVAFHWAFAFRALENRSDRRSFDSLLSAAAMAGALTVWRVALIVPLLEAMFVAIWISLRGSWPAIREWLGWTVAASSSVMISATYLTAQRYILSPAWLAVIAIAAAAFLLRGSLGKRSSRRVVILIAAASIGWGVGWVFAASSPYRGAVDLVWLKLGSVLAGRAPTPPAGMPALLFQVEELYGLTPIGLLIGPQQLLALGPWLLAAPILLLWLAPASGGGEAPADRPSPWLLGFLTFAFTFLTLLVVRGKVLLAPLLAIVCGALWNALVTSRPEIASIRGKPSARRQRLPLAGGARRVIAGGFLLSALATSICGVMLGWSRTSRLEPGLGACLQWLRGHAAPRTVVLSSAFYGYDIQRYSGCASLTDGLLESPRNQQKILESYSALLAPGDSALLRLCRRDRVAYLLVPPPGTLIDFAEVAGSPFLSRLESGLRLEPTELQRPLVSLMLGVSRDPFKQVLERDGYRLYQIADRQ